MAQDGETAAAQRLARAVEQVERWRRTRAKQSPMSAELWDEAVSLARQIGVHPVKAALGLNYESLRQRLALADRNAPRASAGAASAAFVELSGAELLGATATGPVVEISDDSGLRLTVRLAAGGELDVARLVEAFRRRPA